MCCTNPKILLMVGVVISIKSSNMPKFENPWIMKPLIQDQAKEKNDYFQDGSDKINIVI